MTEAIATRRVPGKVSGVETIAKTRGIKSKWVEPAAWSDASTEDWTIDAVAHYDVELWRAGAVVDSARSKGNQHWWPMTKAEALLTGYSTKVFAVGVDGDAVAADASVGNATPEDVTLGNIDGGLTYAQMGTLGVSRYGTTTAMNAAAKQDGDIWINTSFTPTRVYRCVAGAWVYAVDGNVLQAGTVIADALIAGALESYVIDSVVINGGQISGATLQTSITTSIARVVIGGSGNLDKIQIYGTSGTLRGSLKADSGDLVITLNNSSDLFITGGRARLDLAPKFVQTSTTASNGSGGATPANTAGYINILDDGGTARRVPYYPT